ncbi:MFS transporter, partial [Chloroflexota bacterium]
MSKRGKIFYGWWLVAGLFIVGMLGPMARFGMSAFFPFISAEFGWSRSTIGLGQSLTLWIYAILVLLSGRMVDRIGSRKTIFLGGFLCFGGWLLFSTIRFPWQLYLYYGFIMALAVTMTHYVPIQATVRKWFIKRAGFVIAITTAASSIGMATLIPLLTTMSSSLGWRNTSIICAFGAGTIIMLLAFFVIRNTPESMGLIPDGEGSTPVLNIRPKAIEESWSIQEAIRMPQLWLLFTAYGMAALPHMGIIAHLVMWGVDLGSSTATAGIFITATNLSSVITRLGGGWFGDKYGKRRILLIGNLLCLVIMLWAWRGVHSTQSLMIFSVLIGVGCGLPIALYSAYLGDLFGRANIGFLFSIVTMGFGLIGGLGPVIWGEIFEISGSYNPTCLV